MKKSMVVVCLLIGSLHMVSAQTPIPFTGAITGDHTLYVPDDFVDINEALAYLNNKTINADVTVTIQVADGTYTNYPTIQVNHPQGDKIAIIGNTTSPSSCVLEFSGSGLEVDDSNKLGMIDGFTLKGANTANGIIASNGSFIRCGENMIVKNFNQGVQAVAGATVFARGMESGYNTGNGFLAYSGTIDANNAVAVYNQTSGIVSTNGGTINFVGGLSEYNSLYGIQAYWQGNIDARSATTRNNGHYGFLAQIKALIYATGSSASGNGHGNALSQTESMIVQ